LDFSIAILVFGFGIGVLVGMTGMGGGALMTPLLILIFGVSPTTAIGTDILYAAITKTVGGWRHLRMKTVNLGLVFWLALGSVPAALFGVQLVSWLQDSLGEEKLDSLVYAVLGGTLLMVGIITLARALILANTLNEREDFKIELRHKVAAVTIGLTTGFVIGVTSAGSGTVIAVLLIAVFRLAPKRVVGTDVFHAAIVLWAAGIAHFGHGNVDLGLVGNILLGSVPGVVVGAALMVAYSLRRDRVELKASIDELRRVVAAATPSAASAGTGEVVAGTSSYHRPDCALAAGQEVATPMSRAEAAALGLEPCRVCRPDQPTGGATP